MTTESIIQDAFALLGEREGFTVRDNQIQLAHVLSDLMQGGHSGMIEAPTGLGKSLAILIPAIAHSLLSGKRTIVATYTNLLAEQYWRKDLPLAASLFPGVEVNAEFLVGKQRYACLMAMEEHAPHLREEFQAKAELGIESEFRSFAARVKSDGQNVWPKITVPPICEGRQCPVYSDCYFYQARQKAQKAQIVITNHSVVLQDALMSNEENPDGLLGAYDFLVVDEAHDLLQAAFSGLEVELGEARIAATHYLAQRLDKLIGAGIQRMGYQREWIDLTKRFHKRLDGISKQLEAIGAEYAGKILQTSPSDISHHPQVSRVILKDDPKPLDAAAEMADACEEFHDCTRSLLETIKEEATSAFGPVQEQVNNCLRYIADYGHGAALVGKPMGVAVSYVNRTSTGSSLRQDVIDVHEPLLDLLWNKHPAALVSATLAVDGSFDFFIRTTGLKPDFAEILPTPFDYSSQAALYWPPLNTIPDPTSVRRDGTEEMYYFALAQELSKIIEAMQGKTLALFHSRKEMEAVFAKIRVSPDLPIYMQGRTAASGIGNKFLRNQSASLFGLRSFWTGFDAPGETLSCVVVVRIPFEVPIDPPPMSRLAHLQQQGMDPFQEWTLPQAKILIRQGIGRLIRTVDDRGIIAILDPRVRTKRYAESIVDNLPPDLSHFENFEEAMAHVGLGD